MGSDQSQRTVLNSVAVTFWMWRLHFWHNGKRRTSCGMWQTSRNWVSSLSNQKASKSFKLN